MDLRRCCDGTMPHSGQLAPDEFIPIARRDNQIAIVGAWVLDRACVRSRSGRPTAFERPSPSTARSAAVAAGIRRYCPKRALACHRIAAHWLHLEVTETVFMRADDAQILAVLKQLDETRHLSCHR